MQSKPQAPVTRSQTERCVTLERDHWLQHVVDFADDGKGKTFQDWRKYSRAEPDTQCCLCGTEPATRGAHMFGIRLTGVVIVPACALCDKILGLTAKYTPTKFKVIGVYANAETLNRIESTHRKAFAAEQRATPFDEWARASTPLPPSPISDPEMILVAAAPARRTPITTTKKISTTNAVSNYKLLTGFLDEALTTSKAAAAAAKFQEDVDDATPRPTRRSQPSATTTTAAADDDDDVAAAAAPTSRANQFQPARGCKSCSASVCKDSQCTGTSRVNCCNHCRCMKGNCRQRAAATAVHVK